MQTDPCSSEKFGSPEVTLPGFGLGVNPRVHRPNMQTNRLVVSTALSQRTTSRGASAWTIRCFTPSLSSHRKNNKRPSSSRKHSEGCGHMLQSHQWTTLCTQRRRRSSPGLCGQRNLCLFWWTMHLTTSQIDGPKSWPTTRGRQNCHHLLKPQKQWRKRPRRKPRQLSISVLDKKTSSKFTSSIPSQLVLGTPSSLALVALVGVVWWRPLASFVQRCSCARFQDVISSHVATNPLLPNHTDNSSS